jgi:hypothetical protein
MAGAGATEDRRTVSRSASFKGSRMKRTEPANGTASRVPLTTPESDSSPAAVWGHLESIPGFTEELRAAESDLEAGRGMRYEVKGNALRRVQPKS